MHFALYMVLEESNVYNLFAIVDSISFELGPACILKERKKKKEKLFFFYLIITIPVWIYRDVLPLREAHRVVCLAHWSSD